MRVMPAIWTGTLLLCCLNSSCGPERGDKDKSSREESPKPITASGSTLFTHLASKWSAELAKYNNSEIDYEPKGVDHALQRFVQGQYDFVCADLPLTNDQVKRIRQTRGNTLQFPLVLDGVVPVYNLGNIQQPVRFTGPVLADIFLGKIKSWDSPRLKELNPDIHLPNRTIRCYYPAEKSALTAFFTSYLAAESLEWKKQVGTGLFVQWPVGEGIAGAVPASKRAHSTPGGISFAGLGFALEHRMSFGAVRNREGNFIHPKLENVTEAARNAFARRPAAWQFSLINSSGKKSYPICAGLWAVVCSNQTRVRGKPLIRFLTWALQNGQQFAPDCLLAPLPPNVVKSALAMVQEIKISE